MKFESKDFRGFQTRITITPTPGDTLDSLIAVCSGDLDRIETIQYVVINSCPAMTWKEFQSYRAGYNDGVAHAEMIVKGRFPLFEGEK